MPKDLLALHVKALSSLWACSKKRAKNTGVGRIDHLVVILKSACYTLLDTYVQLLHPLPSIWYRNQPSTLPYEPPGPPSKANLRTIPGPYS